MRDTDSRPSTRRRLLSASGLAAVGGLAGCLGGFGSDDAGETTIGESADSMLGGHPAANGVADQPRLGPPPTEAEGVVLAFEDPSCPRCAAFETGTVPKLRREAGDRVSFVLRTYPVVYPWGEPATQAIEAAFAREVESGEIESAEVEDSEEMDVSEEGAYGYRQGSEGTWALVRHYFEEQSQFGTDNVFDRTRTFLDAETNLDAEAVVADAQESAYDDAVQADLSAGEAADAGQTTPTIFLFRDGEFQTSATGSISYDVIEAALKL
jgi:protein-disulfide isomerase